MVVIFEGHAVGGDEDLAAEIVRAVVREARLQSERFKIVGVTLHRAAVALRVHPNGLLPITDEHLKQVKLVFGTVAKDAYARAKRGRG